MASAPSKLYADDVSLVVVLLDTNPFFWSSSSPSFTQFLSHVLAFFNAILTLNQLNQMVVITTGYNSCDYVFDSASNLNRSLENGRMPVMSSSLLQKLEEFLIRDKQLNKGESEGRIKSSLFSGSLLMALCYIQRVFRSRALHPHPRILCLQGSLDGPEQYVAIMNAIFSVQRSEIPIESGYIGAQNSAFLQQASYITGGVHHKPQNLDGLFQYLMTIFATDLHSHSFIHLPKPVSVGFRTSCFSHKNTINMGYVCSVCLLIFCKHHRKCSPCGLVFGQTLGFGERKSQYLDDIAILIGGTVMMSSEMRLRFLWIKLVICICSLLSMVGVVGSIIKDLCHPLKSVRFSNYCSSPKFHV